MRLVCPHCLEKAVIKSSNKLSSTVTDIYAICTNVPACGASFVYTLAYKHDLNPPITSTRQLAMNLINNMPADERKALLQNDLFARQTG